MENTIAALNTFVASWGMMRTAEYNARHIRTCLDQSKIYPRGHARRIYWANQIKIRRNAWDIICNGN